MTGDPAPADPAPADPAPARRRRVAAGRVVSGAATGLAVALLLAGLLVPDRLSLLTPAGLVRLPAEGLLAVALVLAVPAGAPRTRRVVAAAAGAVLGLLAVARLVDLGFFAVLARPFNPVVDWPLLAAAGDFLSESLGQPGATVAVIAAVVLAVAFPVLLALSAVRLTPYLVRHRIRAGSTVAVLAAVWVVCAVLAVQVVPGVPVAVHDYDRVQQVQETLRDRSAFAAEAAADAYRLTPGSELLTALRGKDVVLTFVESYGRDAVEDPEFASTVGAALAEGEQRLDAAGFESRSAFLTSPTVGGVSWLAHATLLSGLWIDNQQRHQTLLAGDRFTLNQAFHRAGWRTVAVMPGIFNAWPEGEFFGYDEIYDRYGLDYRGPRMNWGIMPDQYTLAAFERFERAERAQPGGPPVMAEIALLSSHAPWTPIAPLIDWEEVGDGSGFEDVDRVGPPAEEVVGDPARSRAVYGDAIGYVLRTITSYVETYGDEDLVLIFLGDHQPATFLIGENPSRDVPVTIVAGDPAVLDQISGWSWQPGLTPGPQAPVWRMDEFRDRFLAAFGPAGSGATAG